MKLIDLEPHWLTPNVFVFRCPHCVARGGVGKYDQNWLSVKNIQMSIDEQISLFEQHKHLHDYKGAFIVVPCNPDSAWNISTQDFSTMSVTPSLDASASGHWHGFITNGETV